MSAAVPPIVPYLTVKDARGALDYYARVFGAETLMLLEDEGGVFHARAGIAGDVVMLYEEKAGAPEFNRAPAALGGSPVAMRLDLVTPEAVDRTAQLACDEGGELLVAPTDRPWGRLAEIRDPEGHIWRLAAAAAQP